MVSDAAERFLYMSVKYRHLSSCYSWWDRKTPRCYVTSINNLEAASWMLRDARRPRGPIGSPRKR